MTTRSNTNAREQKTPSSRLSRESRYSISTGAMPEFWTRAWFTHGLSLRNRRVEDDMRPLVRSATQSCKAVERRTRKTFSGPRMKVSARNLSGTTRSVTDRGLQGQSPPVMVAALRSKSKDPNEDERPKEFVQLSSSAPRRLNDIAQGPPEIKEMARSAKYAKREGILSVAQKSMMEQEREKAIARYRTLKASRLSTVGNE